MKKRFQKKSMWKIVFSLFCVPLLLTNCQDEEMPLDKISSSLEQEILVPNISEAQLNFEQSSSNANAYNTQHKNANSKRRNFFVHWKKSRTYDFNDELGAQILYTPVLTENKLNRSKTFLASVKNNKSKIVSKMFSIHYHDYHINEAFSGYIFEKDLEGYVDKIYTYKNGVRTKKYAVKKKNQESKATTAFKQDDCPPMTDEEWQWVLEMLEASGGGTYTSLDCVVIVAYSDDDPTGGEFDADLGLPPVPDELSGGSNSSGSDTTDTRDPVSEDQWWHEETNITPMENEVSIALIEYLPPLTSAQRSFVNNPDNNETNIAILNFLQAAGHTPEAQSFALNAINALIDDGEVDFDNWTINKQPCTGNKEYNPFTNQCECPDGYVEDQNGNCVEKPCENDPIKNPEIVSSGLSGKKGGTFGCTRIDNVTCNGMQGRREHDGVDLRASLNSNVFAMYDGTITSVRNSFNPGEYKKKSFGNYVVLTAVINGETINIKYNHLNTVKVTNGQKVKTGDIIGLSGNTGNANPPKGSVIPHIHLQVRNSNWTIKYDPFDYMYSTFDTNYNNITNDCN